MARFIFPVRIPTLWWRWRRRKTENRRLLPRTCSRTIRTESFSPGRWARFSQGKLPEYGDSPPLDVPSPLGLKVVLDRQGKPRHSVRGIVVHRKHLYVADEAGDVVKVFDVRSGELMAHITGRALKAPVHLIMHGETLYIGASGSGSILALDLTSTPPRGTQGTRGDRPKARRSFGLCRRPGRRPLRGGTEEKAGTAFFSQGEEKRRRSLMTFRTCLSRRCS